MRSWTSAFEVPKFLVMVRSSGCEVEGAAEAESGECGIELPVVGLMVVRRGSQAPWKALQKVGTKGCLQREKRCDGRTDRNRCCVSVHGWTATVRRVVIGSSGQRFAVWFLVRNR